MDYESKSPPPKIKKGGDCVVDTVSLINHQIKFLSNLRLPTPPNLLGEDREPNKYI